MNPLMFLNLAVEVFSYIDIYSPFPVKWVKESAKIERCFKNRLKNFLKAKEPWTWILISVKAGLARF